jgi:hypothetical protein
VSNALDGSVAFVGGTPAGTLEAPITGGGTRMLWYPDKAAWRAGAVTSTHWDKAYTGLYSIAAGYNTMARGNSCFAFGRETDAYNNYSGALNYLTTAAGNYSLAVNQETSANG